MSNRGYINFFRFFFPFILVLILLHRLPTKQRCCPSFLPPPSVHESQWQNQRYWAHANQKKLSTEGMTMQNVMWIEWLSAKWQCFFFLFSTFQSWTKSLLLLDAGDRIPSPQFCRLLRRTHYQTLLISKSWEIDDCCSEVVQRTKAVRVRNCAEVPVLAHFRTLQQSQTG